jgi:hypothetical protein
MTEVRTPRATIIVAIDTVRCKVVPTPLHCYGLARAFGMIADLI